MTEPAGRLAELRDNLAAVQTRIGRACDAAGRPASDITLVAVTKFFPVTDAALLAELGVTDLGESRDQEASVKVGELAGLTEAPVRWHFIGRLQGNKARSVAGYADLVHSVDRSSLVDSLADGARRAERHSLDVLVQLSLDVESASASPTSGRGGQAADELLRLADQVAGSDVLRLAGIMAIASLEGEPAAEFAVLAEVAERLRAAHPQATIVSAGMSSDLEAAVAHGATHVRIGTALLGRRTPHVR